MLFRSDQNQIDTHIPHYLRYACLHWVKHLSKLDGENLASIGLQDGGAIHLFLQEKLLFWLEVLAFIGEAPVMIPIIVQLYTLINVGFSKLAWPNVEANCVNSQSSRNPGLLSLVRDARVFIRGNRWIIEHVPLQIYCSALLFCPKASKIRFHYQHLIPEWITTKPNTALSEKLEVSTLYGHMYGIHTILFSPTEALLASVSCDDTTRVWDYMTGSELYRFQDSGSLRIIRGVSPIISDQMTTTS